MGIHFLGKRYSNNLKKLINRMKTSIVVFVLVPVILSQVLADFRRTEVRIQDQVRELESDGKTHKSEIRRSNDLEARSLKRDSRQGDEISRRVQRDDEPSRRLDRRNSIRDSRRVDEISRRDQREDETSRRLDQRDSRRDSRREGEIFRRQQREEELSRRDSRRDSRSGNERSRRDQREDNNKRPLEDSNLREMQDIRADLVELSNEKFRENSNGDWLNFSSKPYNGNEILPQVLMGGLAVAMMLKNQAKVA